MSKMLKVTLVRSLIGVTAKHRSTIRGLGLRHTGHCVELADTPEVRGMIRKVPYLLRWEELS
ncbi:50S ribosomal protein L30 [Candidatus Igneacidithiobacillus taiwanensis]|uniref:50S ribosomal protein L30 n=2 Tax=Candidatus Igneacidithiobacillus taiwanensis TaxID=1945924 RepID=UPI00289C0333|nr:50S ribosomal protein L30 [Candidatus Igneacidithiobacillus taiwanensis]MCE5361169.1 50S ribosomal protein L30 [Acidithiobacillus sp.]